MEPQTVPEIGPAEALRLASDGATLLDVREPAESGAWHASDWLLLVLLWITGVTGFAIEVALYLPAAPDWGYWVFLFHVAVAMELMLLLPFTKFAHVVYRPVALFFYALARERSTQQATAG